MSLQRTSNFISQSLSSGKDPYANFWFDWEGSTFGSLRLAIYEEYSHVIH